MDIENIVNREDEIVLVYRPNMKAEESMDYSSSGVDIDAEGKAVSSLINALSESTRKSSQNRCSCSFREVLVE